jgi:hypothetical protein
MSNGRNNEASSVCADFVVFIATARNTLPVLWRNFKEKIRVTGF